MATTSLSPNGSRESAAASPHAGTWSPGALLLALALPVLFLHVRYQPGVSVRLGSIRPTAYLSDVVVLLVAVVAVAGRPRADFTALRAGRAIWLTAAGLLVWIAVSVGYGATRSGYAWHTHAVAAAKFAEYALLAVALPLLLRRRADLAPLLAVLVLWTVVCVAIGLVQFFGGSILHAWPAGRRQPSLVGHSDFAALSGMTFCAGLAAAALGIRAFGRQWPTFVALGSGGLGLVLAGTTAGLLGVAAGGAALALLALRARRPGRALATLVSVFVVALGVLGMRGGDYAQFLRFAGVAHRDQSSSADVQTYSQRTLLSYIGLRIFVRHPVLGVGFDGSNDFAAYGPELPAAHRRFPDLAPLAFPARGRSYGIQNLYVQTLADLGAVGAVLLVALLATGLVKAGRLALGGEPTGALALAWLLLVGALWTAQGYVAGIPLDALAWLGFGLAATAVAWRRADG